MSESRRILVTGATGLVGRRLLVALRDDDQRVGAVTRRPDEARFGDGVEPVGWDGVAVAPAELAASDGVVHLAGEPVLGGLPTAARRKRILESRVDSTRALVRAMSELAPAERPRVFVCASAVGIYGDRGEEVLDESVAPGSGFLADVCIAWEKAAQPAEQLGVRTVSLRIGVVLAREGGALSPIATAFRFGLGGRLGNGRQWFPWVHIDDLVGLIRRSLRDERWSGIFNATAPNPVRNAEWTQAVAAILHRPALLPVPALALKLALGETSGELLGSRRVIPKRALELGFRFEFERLEDALRVELG